MFLEIISLLVLVIVLVSPFVIVWYISSNLKRARDLDRVRQDRIVRLISEFEREVTDAMQLVSDCQTNLNEKTDDLLRLIGAQKTYVHFQQEQFNALAKSDMLAARREELLRTKELKVALERLMGVAFTSKQPPAPNDVLALENLDRRIKELETFLKAEGDNVT